MSPMHLKYFEKKVTKYLEKIDSRCFISHYIFEIQQDGDLKIILNLGIPKNFIVKVKEAKKQVLIQFLDNS